MVLIIDGFEVEGTLPVSQLFDKYETDKNSKVFLLPES